MDSNLFQLTMTTENNIRKNKINVCGIGPGNPNLIIPEVYNLVNNSDLIIGGNRQLSIFNISNKETLEIKNNIPQIIQNIKCLNEKRITILVSGDTGFHSLLGSLHNHFNPEEINVIPGISTYQYFFAKLCLTYDDAWIGSVHGKTTDYVKAVRTHNKVFLLTDAVTSWKHIAIKLSTNNLSNSIMYIGNKLSYPDETILKNTAYEYTRLDFNFDLCSLIIINNNPKNDE